MRFVAVDVETANSDVASICQVGVVVFEGGRVGEVWHTLVDPEGDFSPYNVAVHGIRRRDVAGAPTIGQVFGRLSELLAGQVVVHHGAFDRTSIRKVAAQGAFPTIDCRWLDTVRVARRAWPELGSGGYGLANLARACGVEFRHHAAHEDARAAGEVFLRVLDRTGTTLADWMDHAHGPDGRAPAAAGKPRKSRPLG